MRYSTYLEVNLGLLEENFNLIRNLAPRSALVPMVKADAYGNGIIPISQFLVEECGIKFLGCATIGEAIQLRREAPNLDCEILIFSDIEISNNEARKVYQNLNVVPVIHQRSDLSHFLRDLAYKNIPLVLKINTGMNRLGLSEQDLVEFLPEIKKRGVEHLMTHFARSGELSRPEDKTQKQYLEFNRIKKMLIDNGVEIRATSVSNSGAIEQKIGVEETYVRPGLMLYGPSSVVGANLWKGKQISRWITKVLTCFKVVKGTPVGYGVCVADKDSFFVVLPVGYGDGFLTYFSGVKLKINGIEGKIFGRVNMDMVFVQFDLSVEGKIKNNEVVEIWNHDNNAIMDLASQAKTHPYQIMCAISSRIPRIYKVK